MAVTLKSAEYQHLGQKDLDAKLIPASSEDVFSGDCYLELVCLTNETDADVTVTMADKQETPRAVLSQLPIRARDTVSVWFAGRWCKGGLTWAASQADSVTGYVRGRA